MNGARDKFKEGDRVVMNDDALRTFSHRRLSRTGVVVGFIDRSPYLVRIKRDLVKNASTFHMDFWAHDTERQP